MMLFVNVVFITTECLGGLAQYVFMLEGRHANCGFQ